MNCFQVFVIFLIYFFKPAESFEDNLTAPRIGNGMEYDISLHPYMVVMSGRRGANLQLTCSGALITPKWVLTAAHCLTNIAYVNVRAGATDKRYNGETRSAVNIIPHPQFSTKTHYNDIGLIELNSPFQLGGTIDTLYLPRNNSEPDYDDKHTICGWGKDERNQPQNNLRCAVVGLIKRSDCNKNYYKNAITNDMICVGRPGHTACKGDSGGPLITGNTVVGIAFYGSNCLALPSIYTKVSKFRSWIRQHTHI